MCYDCASFLHRVSHETYSSQLHFPAWPRGHIFSECQRFRSRAKQGNRAVYFPLGFQPYNDDSDFIAQGSLIQMRQPSEETPLTFGVGVKAYLGHLDDPDQDVVGFAVGGEVRYTIPGTMPMAVLARGFYAPDITSFSDTEGIIDYTIRFQIEIVPETAGFIGIRHLEIDTDDEGDYDADDDNIHIGVRFSF
jgi:hypothetical protein